jgi:hypothetical protein
MISLLFADQFTGVDNTAVKNNTKKIVQVRMLNSKIVNGYNFNTNTENEDTLYKGSDFTAVKIPGDGYQLFGPGNLIYFVEADDVEVVEEDKSTRWVDVIVSILGISVLFGLLYYVGNHQNQTIK